MRYDAFISYRHGELDGHVAEKLHKMLETYRIPSAIAKRVGKKKLTRVFRDREELPTSSNLSDSITEALENSSFLLLICSRRTCGSMWVMREVELFGQLHGKDKIITLLIDGEPDESFPPGLREREVGGETIFVEPLAADIRAETWKDSIKLLKEEKLRLLAPILGCAFDDLRRRHRRRKIQQAAAVICAAFAFTASFGAFSTYQYMQIDRQMQLKLENQSYVLSEYSTARLADGDRDMAMLLALAALPDNLPKPERPLVPEAEMALANALGVYDVTEGFKPHKSITLPAAAGKVLLSPDEKYAAAVYPYELAIFDTGTGAEIASLPTVRSALSDAAFISGGMVVFTGESGLEAYDIARGETVWRGEMATKIAVSGDGAVIAAVFKNEDMAMLYSGDGSLIGKAEFNGKTMSIPVDDSFINPHDTLFALSGNGKKLAVSFADGALSLFDISTGQETPIRPAGGAIHYAGGFLGDMLLFSVVERDPYNSILALYDSETGASVRQYASNDMNFIPYVGKSGLYAAFDNQIMAVDAGTGDVSHAVSAGGKIGALSESGGGFLIGEAGSAYRFTDENLVYRSDHECHFLDLGSFFALTGSRDSHTLRILKNAPASGNEIFAYDAAYRFSEAKINPLIGRAAFYSYLGMRLHDIAGSLIADTEFPDPYSILNTEYDSASGNVAVIYKDAFRLYSGLDGSLMLEAHGKPDAGSVIYTDFGVSVLDENGMATLYDLATGNAASAMQASGGADYALPLGNRLIESVGGVVVLKGGGMTDELFYEGELVGAGRLSDGGYAFAVSDGMSGKVFTLNSAGQAAEQFSFKARGKAEVYFLGGFVFISPMHGDAWAYDLSGAFVRPLAESGYLAEVFIAGGHVAAGYVSSASERYTLLLKPDTLETVALLRGFLGEMGEGIMVMDNGKSLHSVRLHGTQELVGLAMQRLGGRVLSPDEISLFKAG